MHFPLRSRQLRLSLLASSLLIAMSAQGREKVSVDLPAAPLGEAINALAQQSSVQVIFASDLGAGRNAPAVKGRFTPEEALQTLLKDSGLQVQAKDERTFVIVAQGAPASSLVTPSVPVEMAQMEITASRTSSSLVSATRQSTVLEHEQLQELRQGSESLATVLAKAIPGMSDSSRTITEYGQTLRGRSMLVMVDGVPLNTNRDSSRNLANIDPALIERVEVIRGSSAIYGSGATGGIISITTRPAGGENRAETSLSATSPLTRLGSDGLGGQFQQYFAGSQGAVDYAFDFGTRHIGASYDAHGGRIAPEPSQGDLFDSNIYNIGGKLGLHIDENQRIQLAVSHYDARQDSDYATDPSVAKLPAGSVPANAIKGLDLDEQNRIRNTLVNLEYENLDILGSRLSAQMYYRDYFTRFTPFDARAVATRGGNVDQIMQNSEVFGSRLTLRTPLGESGSTELVWGGDYNQERSDMPLDVFDPAVYDASGGLVFDKTGKLTYMPPLRTRSAGAFAQLQHRFDEHWSVDGGLRYEYSTAEFDDFVPLSESTAASPVAVKGGEVHYDALLSNLGIVYSPVLGQEIYASFSQGFQLPDVGIQLRNARRGFDIGASNLEPVKTNNYELGWRGELGSNTLGTLALFYTTSKLGDVQSFNNGLILTRTKERIYGAEASADWLSDDAVWGAGGSATWMRGREKPDGKGWQDMTGYRVPPLKLTAYVQYKPTLEWSNRLQATFFDAKDYRLDGVDSFGRHQVSSYTTVDLVSQYQISADDKISVGIQNLFNRDYYPLYSQLLRNNNNTSHLPAPGTVLTASYTHNW
ncbi:MULTISPECIES: TonB-dependent receptor [unclassified Pseudomonas]|uniref:TonB-dependent siderophore receptor n=1 Tax=unclassified Pseudomonas TaxID=196821 RepID=UPI0004845EE9|nr:MULTISPECIES: TonB-dependent receptor [Pseudomonas]SMC92146.1 iron complex outermembrane recepter protein [Pseudomonas sp. URIL14HWK12:I5]SNB76374.1 iron complex outermembrane recepter protein [Pseudomonas sp. URIL14HWK12:I8]SNS87546.1 iron complex outermembrane recepter protein [Pseudomonas sp. LAMO17WK12:I8]SNY18781.1 iron complex outermembrane recepter protein [Pseudomonas sp. LAMO17WK12:I12]SNY18814.1 iron complex outermembrane recepter protein [Pseudomonas sp. LAMO17WK12:I11]